MYYDEQFIDGYWRYRTSPDGEWHLMPISMISQRLVEEVKLRRELQFRIEGLEK